MGEPSSDASLSRISGRPGWGSGLVTELLSDAWGVAGSVEQLVSERDQNWSVQADSGERFVLKVANGSESPEVIDLQQQMMRRLVRCGLPAPLPVAARDGSPVLVNDDHLVWMITYLDGTVLAEIDSPSPDLLRSLGRTIGAMTTALEGFDHPAAHRHLQWDVRNSPEVIETFSANVDGRTKQQVVEDEWTRFENEVLPVLDRLPRCLIHNDANDHNILVENGLVSGVLDFGDSVHSVRIQDLAIVCAYAMLDRDDPENTMREIIAGYETVRQMTSEEERVLPALIRMRLVTSVVISAYQQRQAEDDYLRISEEPAWRLLEWWRAR